ncbi:hypothetical protein RvY_13600 [Ramazzottius varieornatus]|uniref:VWFC domain-containing protein n=1 Tax=Ramazzottius varieornatus TaxID=947166 RepID=A0A1D1VNG6_RAMVA|nr:hypothetical protein RvY_13600 [Ramazzottius varieornatus]
MRQFIWIISSSLYFQFLSVDAVKIESSFSGNSAQCVDPFGSSYNAGENVPSINHPCRQCVCGAKATILCESLNRITDCQPPDDAPCKSINGSTCCDRSFSCDRRFHLPL